jgi:hypothetical protein
VVSPAARLLYQPHSFHDPPRLAGTGRGWAGPGSGLGKVGKWLFIPALFYL